MRHVHVMLNKSFSLIDNTLYLLGCFQLQIIENAIQNGFKIERIYYYLISQEWKGIPGLVNLEVHRCQQWLSFFLFFYLAIANVIFLLQVQAPIVDITITRTKRLPSLYFLKGPGRLSLLSPWSELYYKLPFQPNTDKQDRITITGPDQSKLTGLHEVYIKTKLLLYRSISLDFYSLML